MLGSWTGGHGVKAAQPLFLKRAQSTDKSLSEALILASTNPQYDDRLFIELPVQYMRIPSSNLRTCLCTQIVFLFLF